MKNVLADNIIIIFYNFFHYCYKCKNLEYQEEIYIYIYILKKLK